LESCGLLELNILLRGQTVAKNARFETHNRNTTEKVILDGFAHRQAKLMLRSLYVSSLNL
jgi:hypothetical protein